MCSQTPASAHTSATSSIGSTAPVERRARGRDDSDRNAPGRAVGADRPRNSLRHEPPVPVDRQCAHVAGAEPEDLGRPLNRVVRLLRAVERRRGAADTVPSRAWDRPLARRCERRHVRHRAAAREGAGRCREADELCHPADRLILDLRRGGRPHCQVRVEARGEEVAEHADFETRRRDETRRSGDASARSTRRGHGGRPRAPRGHSLPIRAGQHRAAP